MFKRAMVAVLLCLLTPGGALAAPTGKEIMSAVRDRPDGDDRSSTIQLRTLATDGFERKMVMRFREKDEGTDRKTLMYFDQPTDIAGTGLLLYSYEETGEREDDIWLYLPALRKVKRVAARDREGPFMGTDYSYADLERIRVNDYTYEVLGEETLGDRKTYHLAATAAGTRTTERTGYTRLELWVDQERWLILQEHFFDRDGRLKKELHVLKAEQIDGFWTAIESRIDNVQSGSKTFMTINDLHFDSGIDEGVFDKSALTRGLF